MASAADVSIDTMRAYGCGERSVAPHTAPSIGRSDEKANVPATLARRPARTGESPMRSGDVGRNLSDASSCVLRRDHDLLDGGDDPPISGAAADVADSSSAT